MGASSQGAEDTGGRVYTVHFYVPTRVQRFVAAILGFKGKVCLLACLLAEEQWHWGQSNRLLAKSSP